MSYAKEANKILEEYRKKSEVDVEKHQKEVFEKIDGFEKVFNERNYIGYSYVKANISKDTKSIEELEPKIRKLENDMMQMLINNGYPKDYLKKKYNCEKCNDTGVYNNKTCSCKQNIMVNIAREKSSLNNQMEFENFENFDENIFDSNIDNKMGVSQKEFMIKVRDFLEDYSTNYEKSNKSILLYGPVGVGKTFLLSAMAKRIIESGHSLIYFSAVQLTKKLFEIRFPKFTGKTNTEIEDLLYNCDVLMIDDLGTETSTDNNISLLFDLINDRIQKRKTIIISTNVDLESISKQYDQRISSRIMGEFVPIKLFGRDIREKRFNETL